MTGQTCGRNLVLVGFMGTGKSTQGRCCAARLNYAYCDTDRVIEGRIGCTIPEFFAAQGEAVFRKIEREVIADLAASQGLVIATGGGAVLDPLNVQALRRNGFVVLLTASPRTILRRVGNGRTRPLLADAPDPLARIQEMLAQREPHYRRAAHCRVDTSGRPARAVTDNILSLFEMTQQE